MTSGEEPAASGAGYALPKVARITTSDEILGLFRRGKRAKTRHLDVFARPSPVLRSRLGLVVPKPRGKKGSPGRRGAAAVRRNLLKRRLREIGRTALLPALDAKGCGVDVLVRARPEAYEATFGALLSELVALEAWLCSNGG